MAFTIPKESACPKAVLHGFEVAFTNYEVQKERCRFCAKKVYFNKGKTGRVDNNRYLRTHTRDYLQPFGKTRGLFHKIYGPAAIQAFYNSIKDKKTKAEIQAEWERKRKELVTRFTKNQVIV